MKLLFKNVTTYTPETYKNFLHFHHKKFTNIYISYTIFIIIALLFCVCLQFAYHNIGLGILSVFILLCFIVFRFFKPLFLVKKEVKSGKISPTAINTFCFYENSFLIKNQKGESKMKYYKLHRVYETKDFFYLYLDSTYAFLLKKDNFSYGTSNNFSRFIKKKCSIKFKKKIS